MNNTLHKGLKLLEILSRSTGPLGITELASRASLGKSDVHRLMQSLVELGFARRESSQGVYAASTRMWELGTIMVANLQIRRAAMPQLLRLADVSRETVQVAMLDGLEVVCLQVVAPAGNDLQDPFAAGSRLPALATATGLAMLSTFDDEALDEATAGVEPTDHIDPMRALARIARVREVGYAVSEAGPHDPSCSLAAPIVGARSVAALGLTAPADRLQSPRLEALGELVGAAARLVSAELVRISQAAAGGGRRGGGHPLRADDARTGPAATSDWPAPLPSGAQRSSATALETREV